VVFFSLLISVSNNLSNKCVHAPSLPLDSRGGIPLSYSKINGGG
jgi:hypothetical protein